MTVPPKSQASRDRDLLFGVLAVQNRFVTPEQLAGAAAAWAISPESDLSELLVQRGHLSRESQELINSLVRLQLMAHGDDAQATLNSFGGDAAVHQSFAASLQVTDQGGVCSLMSFGGDAIASVSLRDGPAAVARLDDPARITCEHPGRYLIKSEHGRGGIGRVMIAYDEHVGRDVALKELLPPRQSDSSFPSGISPSRYTTALARFLREARITGQLEHPGIVPVYEIAKRRDDSLYYTMKLVRGKTLGKKLREAKTLPARLLLLPHFLDLCQAMAYAHSRGVIHRDLKPQNVMVGEFGETVLLDWGLAKVRNLEDERAGEIEKGRQLILSSNAGDTIAGQTLGTPSYMSPEQAEGRVKEIDERSDVWSLGAILYEFLTGAPPFTGDLAYEVMTKVIMDPVAPIAEREPKAPPELAAIAHKCLSRDRNQRYADAAEVAADIARFQSGGLVSAYEYSAAALAAKWLLKRWPVMVTGAAALLAVLALGTWSVIRIRHQRDQIRQNLAQAFVQKGEVMEERNYLNEARVYYASALMISDDPDARSGLYRELSSPLRTVLAWMPTHPPPNLLGVAFTRDNRRAAVGACLEDFNETFCSRTRILILAIPGGQLITAIEGPGDFRRALAFSPDEKHLLGAFCGKFTQSRCLQSSVRVWDAWTGRQERELLGTHEQVRGVAVSPVGGRIAAGGCRGIVNPAKLQCVAGEIVIWDPDGGKPALTITGHTDSISALAYSPAGDRIVSVGNDYQVMVWDAITGAQLFTLAGHGAEVYTAAVSPDGKLLATGSDNNDVKIWNFTAGELLHTFLGHQDSVVDLAFSPDAHFLASASDDRTVKLWDLHAGRCIRTITGYPNSVRHVAYSADGKYLESASVDGTLRVWQLLSGDSVRVLADHGDWVRAAAISPDGGIIATGAHDGWVRLFSRAGKLTAKIPAPRVNCLAFSPDGNLLAYGAKAGEVGAFQLPGPEAGITFAGHSDRVRDIRFSRDGAFLLSAGEDSYVKLWDVAKRTLAQEFWCDNFQVYTTAFWPDESQILSGGADQRIRFWDRDMGIELMEWGMDAEVRHLEFSPDGKTLAVALGNSQVLLLDAASWQTRAVLAGHKKIVLDLAFSPDGRYLASVGGDQTCRLWDTSAGRELYSMVGHQKYVWSVAYAPDGNFIVTGSGDNTARIWPVIPYVFKAAPKALFQEAITETGLRLNGFDIEPWNPVAP